MKAVIVIDVLNGFCKAGNLASPRLAKVIPCIKELLEKELAAGSMVVFVADTHVPGDPEFEMFPPHCVAGSGEDEVVDELKPYVARGTLVRKDRYSAFIGTGLERILSDIDPEEVILTGVCTDICIMHAAADLRNLRYRVAVPLDCVETYDAPGHDGDEAGRFAVAHMRDVLGVRIIG